jgi:hypothetical protein
MIMDERWDRNLDFFIGSVVNQPLWLSSLLFGFGKKKTFDFDFQFLVSKN